VKRNKNGGVTETRRKKADLKKRKENPLGFFCKQPKRLRRKGYRVRSKKTLWGKVVKRGLRDENGSFCVEEGAPTEKGFW